MYIVVDSRVCTICKVMSHILSGTDCPYYSKFLYIINKPNTLIVVALVHKNVFIY